MSTPYPLSVQLYTLRDEITKDNFFDAFRVLSHFGYHGVEFAGLHDHKPADVRKALDDYGLVASSAHTGWPTKENVNEMVDTAKTLGYDMIISGGGPDQFKDKETVIETAKKMEEAAALAQEHGLRFGYHNHWWEFDKSFEGKLAHEVFMEHAPSMFAQIDTYWVKVGGADPAKVVADLGARCPILHIKDGPANKPEEDMVAVGEGSMQWPPIMQATTDKTEWLVVELDRCASDMWEAVSKSRDFLVKKGYARQANG